VCGWVGGGGKAEPQPRREIINASPFLSTARVHEIHP
jgi:hypothetical protein